MLHRVSGLHLRLHVRIAHLRLITSWAISLHLPLSSGLVRAPISTTSMQVASRLLLVWGVVNNFPDLAESVVYSSMLVAWSVTEVIRYSYFVLNLSGYQPAFVTWLRYNTFFVLYPVGISSECWMIYKAIEPARQAIREFAWALQLILLIYIPGQCSVLRVRICGMANGLQVLIFSSRI